MGGMDPRGVDVFKTFMQRAPTENPYALVVRQLTDFSECISKKHLPLGPSHVCRRAWRSYQRALTVFDLQGALSGSRRDSAAGAQHTHLVTQDLNGFVQINIVGIFPHFFSGKFSGELSFTRLQAIIPP